MLKNPKAVIFDMDGVLLDTEPLHSRSLETILLEYKKTPQYNEQGLLHTVGLSGDQTYVDFLAKYAIQESIEIFKSKRRKFFENLIKTEAKINKGVLPLLKRLQKANVKIGLASNRNLIHIILIVETLKIKDYFSTIVGPSEKLKHKPAPDIYLEVARLLKIKPNDCIVIEDSEPGLLSGKAAGMKVIAIPNLYTNHQDFSKSDTIINNFDQITLPVLKHLAQAPKK
jgi:HAD superfamily hydrolase (TIGR01509 family)